MDQGRPDAANTIQNSFVSGAVIQVGNVTGDLTVVLARPGYQVHRLRPAERPAFVPERHRSPSHLLNTRSEVVPYLDRPAEQERLLAWLASPAPASVLLLHGVGGRGKTRLANAFATHTHAIGWHVAHALNAVTDKASLLPDAAFAADTPTSGVLVAVDYAERWPLDDLLALVTDLTRTHRSTKLRVLLLARSIQDLWQPLCAHLDLTSAELPDPVELTDLTGSAAARTAAFHQAAQAFHDALALPGACTTSPPSDLAHDDYASPLILHMAALSAVCAARDDEVIPQRDNLSSYLLAHERRLWPKHPHAADAVFIATLFGPVADEDTALVLFRTAHLTDGAAASHDLLAWHDRVYPSPRALAPLLPDRFGEDYVADHLQTHPRARSLMHRLARSDRVEARWLRRPMTVLIATADRHPHVREALWELLEGCTRLFFTPTSALLQLAIDHAPFSIRTWLADQLPRPEIGLRELSLALVRSVVRDLTDDMSPEFRARCLAHLAARTINAGGVTEQATEQMNRAMAIMETAWHRDPAKHAAEAGQLVLGCGVLLAANGDLTGALELTARAIHIIRTSPASNSRSVGLVRALGEQAGFLRRAGGDWSPAAREALELAQSVTGSSTPLGENLALATDTLARMFAEERNLTEAISAGRVSVIIYLRLSKVSQDLYATPAVLALNRLAGYLAETGEFDTALDTMTKAIHIARRQQHADPATVEHVLPELLANATQIALTSSTDEALGQAHAYATESARLYRVLTSDNPEYEAELERVQGFLDAIERR